MGMIELISKHALIIGGIGTIRAAMASVFAGAGASVTILDRPDAVATAGFGWLGVDLNDLADAQAEVAAAGPFDILVNNAALIINLTSLALSGQWDGYLPYAASKGAMLGLTKGLARELGPNGITVNAIARGAIVSAAENRVFGERLEEYNKFVLEGQCVTARILPEDVANLSAFLASEAARLISAQNIGIDGGW